MPALSPWFGAHFANRSEANMAWTAAARAAAAETRRRNAKGKMVKHQQRQIKSIQNTMDAVRRAKEKRIIVADEWEPSAPYVRTFVNYNSHSRAISSGQKLVAKLASNAKENSKR